MKLVINDISKCEQFVAIFQQLKTLSSSLFWEINPDNILIQGIDQGNVCMFQLVLDKSWFDCFTIIDGEDESFYICSTLLSKFLNTRFEHQSIEITLCESQDKINITLNSDKKSEFKKSVTLALLDADHKQLNIPEMEYTAEFSIESKKLNVLVDQLSLMDDIVKIHCDDEVISFKTYGLDGEMDVTLPHDDIDEYLIDEDTSVDVRYSLAYMKKLCQYHKVSDVVEVQVSVKFPLMVTYKLNPLNTLNYLKFYLAPKIDDYE